MKRIEGQKNPPKNYLAIIAMGAIIILCIVAIALLIINYLTRK